MPDGEAATFVTTGVGVGGIVMAAIGVDAGVVTGGVAGAVVTTVVVIAVAIVVGTVVGTVVAAVVGTIVVNGVPSPEPAWIYAPASTAMITMMIAAIPKIMNFEEEVRGNERRHAFPDPFFG